MLPISSIGQANLNDVRSDMLVSTSWLADHLHDPNVVVLCIADNPEFYTRGHIAGARLIKFSDLVITRDGIPNELASLAHLQAVFENAGISNHSRIVLYGERSGILPARAYFTLDYLGIAGNAALLDGGMEKWRAEHREETSETPAIKPGKLTLQLNSSISANSAGVADAVHSKPNTVVLLDARPNAEFSGAKFSEDVPKAGHIPGAHNLYWRDLLADDNLPVLRPTSELREMLRAGGVAPESQVITYCRTGMQSSFDYFVAKYLGYRVRMYDGSFFEWSRKNLPVEKSSR